MARGITIKITRPIERRKHRNDDVGVHIWTGTCWRSAVSLPYSAELAYIYGSEPKIVRTKIEFLPPGVVAYTTLRYQQTLERQMRAMGVIQ